MAGPALRVGFAGTPEFAAVALQEILSAGFTVPLVLDRKSTRLNSSHSQQSRMPSSA